MCRHRGRSAHPRKIRAVALTPSLSCRFRILGKRIEREEDLIRVLSWITERSSLADTPKTRNKVTALLGALRKGLGLGTGSMSVSNLVCGVAGFSGDDALKKDQLVEFALGVANDRLAASASGDRRAAEPVTPAAAMEILRAIQPVAVQAISSSKRSGCVVEALRVLKAGLFCVSAGSGGSGGSMADGAH